MPPLHLLIKPSSGMCNLQCQYCFYHDIVEKRSQNSYGFMSEETLEQIVKKALDYAEGSCTIAFQGGEPTLIGLSFYQHLIDLEKKYNKKNLAVHYAIQTNGYHLEEKWAEFFAKYHFLVGISLDGTIHTHDAFRKTPSDKGTFQDIMQTIAFFQKHQVDFNILTVVNKKTANAVSKLYKFYQKNGFSFLQFIPCLDPFDSVAGKQEYSLTPALYGKFLCELFDLWYEDYLHGKSASIRQFENYIALLLYHSAESCDMNGICSIQNVIEADGEVYPCDFFVLDEYKLGNLNTVGFEEINQKRKDIQFIERSFQKDENCKKCQYYPICRGGCARYRTMSGGYADRNYFCESYRLFFDHCLERLLKIAHFISSSPK